MKAFTVPQWSQLAKLSYAPTARMSALVLALPLQLCRPPYPLSPCVSQADLAPHGFSASPLLSPQVCCSKLTVGNA